MSLLVALVYYGLCMFYLFEYMFDEHMDAPLEAVDEEVAARLRLIFASLSGVNRGQYLRRVV